ncbi:larval cuticle protein A1A [Drosophila hydei]|uniref:Larval cuticle protein A1A n=1 Tax=Drosophila hydei TaxID=7224 RepID=A0A6J1LJU2_DROHY|nr:larval cuticle protein A1A [Drosophila hydei]
MTPASNSGEEYQTNYQTTRTNAENSQATPTGYDYNGQLENGDAKVLQAVTHGASGGAPLFPQPLPVLHEPRQPEIFPPASYSFDYAVNDETTGDIKDHRETRDGYVVRGSYSLIDPDGYKRTVTYTADDVHGFNAIVNRVPIVLKKLAIAPTNVLLDERSPVVQASTEATATKTLDNSLKAITADSYVNAAKSRDTSSGIYE